MQKISLLAVFYFLSLGLVIGQVEKDAAEMSLVVKSAEKKFSNDYLTVVVEFKNISNKTIRLLEYDHSRQLGVMFFTQVSIQNERYKLAAVKPGPPKFEFVPDDITTYVEIPKNKSYSQIVDFRNYLRNGGSKLRPGLYRINANYVNWYGGDCIKGFYKAKELLVRVDK
ncbi:hypothetical protein [Hymenobacter sp. GOD-10R]|uniref:hypothetical protein n=1 Tax=Hymenobacter sp. GOD-10R TaxID=3093922 RepID=UPI002D7A1995|nr:hypothetical protein [Hymenobacter sp. GOD-10R]WRQ30804.1 hypothetical protein SD425_11075 [Hymenobacter sp. GOD-10R]